MRLLVLLAVLAVAIGRVVWGQCVVPIKDLKETTPVFFQNGEYMKVENGNFEWTKGEKTYITCAESRFKNFPNESSLFIECEERNNFKVVGYNESRPINRLECSSLFRGTFRSGPYCREPYWNEKLVSFGFVGDHGFRTYFSICYNDSLVSPMYSEHTLQGGLLQYASYITNTADFADGRVPIVNVNKLYEEENTKKVFEGLSKPADSLAKGQLIPYEDGVMPYFMRLTFFHDNVVPQWQIIKESNWKTVENEVRNKVKELQRDLLIFTGVHDVLRLASDTNTEHPIYLKSNKLSVPKWMWKIIKDKDNDEAIAFVTFNNPFRRPNSKEMLCTDICGSIGWNYKEFKTIKNGYTYCCTVESLMEKIDFIPLEARATKVMKK